ncbi:MAG: HIRAN domain-containing protein [Clostridia bacterium]|nr:HIRAN domain-containing protein [Clostridia bacterium]
MHFEHLDFNVSGVTFEGRQEVLKNLRDSGKDVFKASLVHEPENKFDDKAVKVMVGEEGQQVQIGYVPAIVASNIFDILNKVTRAKVKIGYSSDLRRWYANCDLTFNVG